MADISVQCASCQSVLTVSEYADLTTMQCPKCEQPLSGAPSVAEPESPPKLQVRHRAAPTPPPADDTSITRPELPSIKPDAVTLWLGPDRWKALKPLAHWLVFIVLLFFAGMVIRLRFAGIVNWMLYG